MSDLGAQNPWWAGPQHIEDDPDYSGWLASSPRWEPRLLKEVDLASPSLSFILGPRQVGKTTLVKLLVKRLLDGGAVPESILYYRCDQLADFKELDEVIREYLRLRKSRGIERSYLFLDEVTYPSQWWRAVKFLIDVGDLRNDSLVLTGSLSMFATGEVETFPGRRGTGRDHVMHPLSFRDFCQAAGGRVSPEGTSDIRSGALTPLASSFMFAGEASELFRTYLVSGGFPSPVKSVLRTGTVAREVLDSQLSWIKGDLARVRANESIAKRVLKAIIEKAPSRISLNSVARELEIGSHRTVFRYLDLLEKLFVLKTLYFVDLDTGRTSFTKNRKVHVTDPYLYTVLSRWCLTERPKEEVIVESVVAWHLSRRFDVGYWSDGSEVDVVVDQGTEATGVEVKYQNNPSPARLSAGRMREVVTLSRSSLNEKPPMFPVSSFLQLLEV